MDGPNVDKAFERKHTEELEERWDKSFLRLNSCHSHKVCHAFINGIMEFLFNLNGFFILHPFFLYWPVLCVNILLRYQKSLIFWQCM